MALQRDLAETILATLREREWTQAMLAERARMTQKHLSQMLTGKIAGSVEMWDRLARELGLSWSVGLVERDPE